MLISFCGLLVLTRWITKHVQGIGYLITEDGQIALVLYFMIILPGVLLHEFSHAIAAWLLRVRVGKLSIGLQRKRNSRSVALGSVEIARTDPIRASLIGLAPLVSGCAIIMLISNRVLGLEALPPLGSPGFWQSLRIVYNVPDVWLWIYLVLAIGNAMFPSAADRRAWVPALIFIAFLGAALYFSGLLDTYSVVLARWGRNGASQLTYAFTVTAIVDLIFVIVLFLAEQVLALLGLGRLEFR
jgi:hypothetical protein